MKLSNENPRAAASEAARLLLSSPVDGTRTPARAPSWAACTVLALLGGLSTQCGDSEAGKGSPSDGNGGSFAGSGSGGDDGNGDGSGGDDGNGDGSGGDDGNGDGSGGDDGNGSGSGGDDGNGSGSGGDDGNGDGGTGTGTGGADTTSLLCVPGATVCDDNQLVTCNETGTGFLDDAEACDTGFACLDGACRPFSCEPESDLCLGRDVVTCSEDGLGFSVKEDCEHGCNPETAACYPVCRPGVLDCDGEQPATCDETGQWRALGPLCTDLTKAYTCQAGACVTRSILVPGNNGPDAETFHRCTFYVEDEESGELSLFHDVGATTPTATLNPSPAFISDFRLDEYEVTVGQFRRFVDALEAGWLPEEGSGKHVHLNGGLGLLDSDSIVERYEPGWDASWSADLVTTKEAWTALGCHSGDEPTWTEKPGDNEDKPINCVNWRHAYAYCIWDGGFLPSETEWDYAASGGTEQRYYPWSVPASSQDLSSDHAVYSGAGAVAEVGSKSPLGDGRFGHKDLAGNTREWLLDFRQAHNASCTDCANVFANAGGRTARGGSFKSTVIRNSTRFAGSSEANRSGAEGLRCARPPAE